MKVITSGMVRALDHTYTGVKFPVFILHSTEELENYCKEIGKPPKIMTNVFELSKYVATKTDEVKDYQAITPVNTQDDNVWLATGEIYKPDKFVGGAILYQTEDGMPIKTDNCYVQLLGFKLIPKGMTVATSSGLFNLSFWGGWVTAALKPGFEKVSFNPNTGTPEANKRKYNKLLQRKKLSPGDVRFIFYSVLPSMPFKNIYQAAHKAYGVTYPKKIIDKLLETERIQRGIIKEIAKMIPNFEEVLLKIYTQEEIAEDIKAMVKKTLDRNSAEYDVEATRKALSVVFKLLDQPTAISPYQNAPLVAGAIPNMVTPNEAIKMEKQLAAKAPKEILDGDIEEFEKEMGVPLTGSAKPTSSDKNNNQIVDIQ